MACSKCPGRPTAPRRTGSRRKDNGMAKPILDALKQLMANGTYLKILQKWGVQAGAISTPVINGATS